MYLLSFGRLNTSIFTAYPGTVGHLVLYKWLSFMPVYRGHFNMKFMK